MVESNGNGSRLLREIIVALMVVLASVMVTYWLSTSSFEAIRVQVHSIEKWMDKIDKRQDKQRDRLDELIGKTVWPDR